MSGECGGGYLSQECDGMSGYSVSGSRDQQYTGSETTAFIISHMNQYLVPQVTGDGAPSVRLCATIRVLYVSSSCLSLAR